MKIRCNHCGLPVDTDAEPQAMQRDPILVICDLCNAMRDDELLLMPEFIYG